MIEISLIIRSWVAVSLDPNLCLRNVLVGDNSVVKIADFGLARLIKVYSVHNLLYSVHTVQSTFCTVCILYSVLSVQCAYCTVYVRTVPCINTVLYSAHTVQSSEPLCSKQSRFFRKDNRGFVSEVFLWLKYNNEKWGFQEKLVRKGSDFSCVKY